MSFDFKNIFGKKSDPEKQEGYDGLLKEIPSEIVDVKEPTGASIRREYIYIFIGVVVALFVLSFLFGIYNTKKSTAPEEVKLTNRGAKGAHLDNVPSKYSDATNTNRQEEKKPIPPQTTQLPQQREVEYQPPRQQYQRIPSPPQPVSKNETVKIDPAIQLRLQQAKEKDVANKSPIQFSINNDKSKNVGE